MSSIVVSQLIQPENEIRTYIENSVPYIGTEIPRMDGIDGTGIKIAVIDTGVDFNHPDLFGWGPDGKVIGGYNFIEENELPMDTNGHGTKVAGKWHNKSRICIITCTKYNRRIKTRRRRTRIN